MNKKILCPDCDGKGKTFYPHAFHFGASSDCELCKGKGTIKIEDIPNNHELPKNK